MTYRDHGDFTIADLKDHEQLAFGALLRTIMVAAEVRDPDILGQLAADLGRDDFWAMLDRATHEVAAGEAHELASAVERAKVQVLIYTCVSEVAMFGSITMSQMTILDELRRIWGIQERKVDNPYRD